MNIPIILDNLTASIGGIYGDGYNFFREGVFIYSFEEAIDEIEMVFRPPVSEGEYIIPVIYKDREGICQIFSPSVERRRLSYHNISSRKRAA